MPPTQAPLPALRRLPRYHQYLVRLRDAGQEWVSAAHLAEVLEVHHTQVRKDLAWAGCIGRPKTGHRVTDLLAAIETFLGWNRASEAFLAGAGSLGTALLNYRGFGQAGARIVAAFDRDPAKVGTRIGDIPVLDIERLPDLAQRMHIQVGILTVPAEAAQAVADRMVQAGIRAIWNLTPAHLAVPRPVIVENLELFNSFALLLRRLGDRP